MKKMVYMVLAGLVATVGFGNLITNPSYETAFTGHMTNGWESWGMVRDSAFARTGSYSSKGSTTASGFDWKGCVQAVQGLTAGDEVSMSVYFYHDSTTEPLTGDTKGQIQYKWFQADNATQVGADQYSAHIVDSSDAAGSWHPIIQTATVPAGASVLQFIPFVQSSDGSDGSLWADDASVTVIPEPVSALLMGLGMLGIFLLRRKMA